jgi:hypothetical protein
LSGRVNWISASGDPSNVAARSGISSVTAREQVAYCGRNPRLGAVSYGGTDTGCSLSSTDASIQAVTRGGARYRHSKSTRREATQARGRFGARCSWTAIFPTPIEVRYKSPSFPILQAVKIGGTLKAVTDAGRRRGHVQDAPTEIVQLGQLRKSPKPPPTRMSELSARSRTNYPGLR